MKHLKLYILLFIVFTLFISLFFLLKKENNVFIAGVSRKIDFYGTEQYEKLLGYQSFFPEKVLDNFHMDSVSLGITLTKEVTKNKFESLKSLMHEAVIDNKAFNKLSDYMPYRDSAASYRCNMDPRRIGIITLPAAKYETDHIKENLVEFEYTFNDQKTDIDSPFKLSFTINDVAYIVTIEKGESFSQDEILNIVNSIKFR